MEADELNHDGLSSLSLLQLTHAGTREAARRLMLSGSQAVRHHGLLGSRARVRSRWLRHLSHTIGANGVFVALASGLGLVSQRSGNDAHVSGEAPPYVHADAGRMGSGVPSRSRPGFGFFLEYDRGTERAREYAAKMETYYRYRDTGAAARDYAGFPTVLVVTTRAAAETRFAHEAYLAWERRGGKALPLLLTTTQLIETHPEGILGPIWRSPSRPSSQKPVRGYWLPGGPPRLPVGIDRRTPTQPANSLGGPRLKLRATSQPLKFIARSPRVDPRGAQHSVTSSE